ncbi:MAG TPA: HAD-IA family hydrolase [Candidatus Binatia bacterium]|nr:HAD-IA family hydrolase [Candidatus Binatia bacterium]
MQARMPLARPATHVVFDMDGVLLDTERFYTEVTQDIVGRFGKTFDWSVKSRMIGRPAIEAARTLVEALALPMTAEDYLAEREEALAAKMPSALPMPGARELTEELARLGVPLAVATSSSRRFFDLKTERHRDWFRSFAAIVVGDDPRVARGKPAPDIFLVAARELGADPAGVVVVEDAPAGVAAARAAGMQVVAVPYPGMDPASLADADLLFESLADVRARDLGVDRQEATAPVSRARPSRSR